MIWIGTSGFACPEWKGNFYPPKLSTKKMLAYYGTAFATQLIENLGPQAVRSTVS